MDKCIVFAPTNGKVWFNKLCKNFKLHTDEIRKTFS